MKNVRKNKKGFTLVEVIVVLLIVGILLAITIPSIMGYVGKAQDARYEAEGRSGYVAAQTIVARTLAGGGALKNSNGDDNTVTAALVTKELGETTGTIDAAGCIYDKADNTATKITKCAFTLHSNGDKTVIFDTTKDVAEPTIVVKSDDKSLAAFNLK